MLDSGFMLTALDPKVAWVEAPGVLTSSVAPLAPPCTPHAIRYGSAPFERTRDRPRPPTCCPAMPWAVVHGVRMMACRKKRNACMVGGHCVVVVGQWRVYHRIARVARYTWVSLCVSRGDFSRGSIPHSSVKLPAYGRIPTRVLRSVLDFGGSGGRI